MKRLLLFMFLVGAAVYLFVGQETPEADRTPPPRHVELAHREPLRNSWGSNLHSLREKNQQPSAQASRVSARPTPAEETSDRQVKQLKEATDEQPAIIPAVGPAIQWVRVTRAVEVRRKADVSSPGLRHYPAGSEAMVVGGENVWVQLLDPRTGERGFVYHGFLTPIDGPSATSSQVAATTHRAQEPNHSVKLTDRRLRKVATVKRSRAQAAETPKRRKGLFGFFGRKAARPAWTVGPSR